jgi:hypothetical protein
LPSSAFGTFIRAIPGAHPAGGSAVQIGNPADLSYATREKEQLLRCRAERARVTRVFIARNALRDFAIDVPHRADFVIRKRSVDVALSLHGDVRLRRLPGKNRGFNKGLFVPKHGSISLFSGRTPFEIGVRAL